MHTITKQTKKQIKHSSKTPKNVFKSKSKSKSTSTLKNCYDYLVNTKSEYQVLFKTFDCYAKEKNWEMTHLTEDEILEKFINEIIQNKYKTKKEILTTARMINEKVLSKANAYTKWYA